MKKAAMLLAALACAGCRTITVAVVNPNGTTWNARAVSFVWESQIDSLVIEGVGSVSGFKSGSQKEMVQGIVEGAVSGALKAREK